MDQMINTVCIALPRSIIGNALNLEFKTYLTGQVYGNKGLLLILLTFKILMYFCRGAAIFSVDELIMFDDEEQLSMSWHISLE